MKFLIALSTSLTALLFVSTLALAQTSDSAASEQYGGPSDTITGVVSEVSPDGSSVVVSDGAALYDMTITPSTRFVDGVFYIPENAPPRTPTVRDLKPGLEVEVKHTGFLAQSYPAQGEATRVTFLSPWYEEDAGTVQKTFRGYLTSVTEGEIRVQQNPEATVEDPGYCDQALDFTLVAGTEIADTLTVGQYVEVTYTYDPDAVYTLQCPGKFPADAVTVLSDGGSGDGQDNSDSGSGTNEWSGTEESSEIEEVSSEGESSGAVASNSYAVLPDTGGPSVAGAMITLIALSILVAVYRTSSERQ